MLRSHHIPSATGDYELRDAGGDRCLLIVENPTAAERTILNRFLETARKKKWADPADAYNLTGRTEMYLSGPIAKVAPVLAGKTKGDLTAVRSVDGQVTTVLRGVDDGTAGTEADTAESKALKDPNADVAATVKRPTLCCPQPVLGPMVRSEGVLHAFSTERQRRTWRDHGYVEVLGGLSGHAYRIHHREHADAVRHGYITYDLDDAQVLHGHDWTVPPAEEVLSFALWLASPFEWYVRNEASGFGPWRRAMGLPEPPGGLMFGTFDSAFLRNFSTGYETGKALRDAGLPGMNLFPAGSA